MKYFLSFLIVLFSFSLFGQAAKPAPIPKNTTTTQTGTSLPKDSVIYMTPIGFEYDTLAVWAVVVDIKTPLAVSSYSVISKNWTYEDGKKQLAEQWLETGGGVKINDWRKRIIWIQTKTEYKD